MSEPAWKQIDCGQERWWVDPAWSQELLDGTGLRLKEWTDEGKVEIIKHSLNRTVYRVGLAEKPVYVKHYPVHDLRSRVRHWVRNAKAWIEWQRTIQLQERLIPTIKPVAVGQHPEFGSYIVTEEIPQSVQLKEYLQDHWPRWKQAGDTASCTMLIAELARFLAEMLQHGIVHQDLHAGNILLHTDPAGKRHWFLIDPYSTQTQPPNDRAALLSTLCLIAQSFWQHIDQKDLLLGWVIFRRASGYRFEAAEERKLLADAYRQIEARQYRHWNRRASRNTKANRDFYELRVRRCHAWASRSVQADWLAEFLYDPDQVMQCPPAQLLKASRHGMVAIVPAPREAMVIKRFDARHFVDRWIGRWRRSPALHCYRMAYRLQTAGIPVAKPLAFVEQVRHGQLLHSYMFMEHLEETTDLSEYWKRGDDHQRRHATRQLAGIVHKMHCYRISHRDMKATNILVRENAGNSISLFLIDYRGVSHSRWLTRTRRMKDLTRLALSAMTTLQATPTTLLRFLVSYLPASERTHWRMYWKQIARYLDAKVRQNARRHRTLS